MLGNDGTGVVGCELFIANVPCICDIGVCTVTTRIHPRCFTCEI